MEIPITGIRKEPGAAVIIRGIADEIPVLFRK